MSAPLSQHCSVCVCVHSPLLSLVLHCSVAACLSSISLSLRRSTHRRETNLATELTTLALAQPKEHSSDQSPLPPPCSSGPRTYAAESAPGDGLFAGLSPNSSGESGTGRLWACSKPDLPLLADPLTGVLLGVRGALVCVFLVTAAKPKPTGVGSLLASVCPLAPSPGGVIGFTSADIPCWAK